MINKNFKDELIILKRFCINENDLLVTAFGKHSGKIQLKAKGSKKILSKFTGRLEPLNIISAEIYNSGKSFTLTNANLKSQSQIDTNLETFQLCQKICIILNKSIPFEEPNPTLFHLIQSVITSILCDQNCKQKTDLFFLTKFLDIAGLLPNFMFCHNCHKKFDHDPFLENINLACHNCATQGQKISLQSLKLLNFINSSSRIEHLTRIKIPNSINQESGKLLENLINFN